ncbi:NAD(P) transhydrogenase subunit alpha [Candidatus Aerophobetes bacterium]|nr:NAD(P) transhydrogenase subunit alpha [Candidatus Aerophobetes bacterium]
MWFMALIFVVTLAAGYRIIRNIPSLLHTPLMSGMNALSGVTVVGALVVMGTAIVHESSILAAAAVFLATVNIVAGFLVTHRMLRMFKKKKPNKRQP